MNDQVQWALVRNESLKTVKSLCEWIQLLIEKGPSSEELVVLPEVVKATAELYKSVK